MRFNPILTSTAGSWASGCRFQIFIARKKSINYCSNKNHPDLLRAGASLACTETQVGVSIQLHV